MTLIIDTSDSKYLKVAREGFSFIKTPALFKQSEKLLPAIVKLLNKENLNISNIKKIKVASSGDSFTALRVGLLTANTLAYALDLPIESLGDQKNQVLKIKGLNIIKAQYRSEPNIGQKK